MKSKKETIAGWRLRIWGLKRWNLIENQLTSSPMAVCYVYLIWCFHSKKAGSCQNWLIFVWTFESLKGPQTLPWPALHWEHLITCSSIVISLQLYGPLCALIFKFKLRISIEEALSSSKFQWRHEFSSSQVAFFPRYDLAYLEEKKLQNILQLRQISLAHFEWHPLQRYHGAIPFHLQKSGPSNHIQISSS